ncbi:GNAT family N-acetyltransferase [Pontibacter litorisediminis]|uniref:GNAT family N-acetyltransferase n=1 Tax=Pontibacter litorisediminis TaxID=1846260 RepID=UPI0023ECE285|nr:GNAT family N-acetyltransferase [Pontibacter litorisediminis]
MNNTSYHIRQAAPADIPTLMQLAEATWEPTYRSILPREQIEYMFEVIYSRQALEQQMQDGQTFLLLQEGELPLGFASFSVKDAAGKVYKLNKIYLLPQTQGKGYGKVLLQAVEQEVRQRGAALLDLNVNRYNPAKSFYERCGYQVHRQEDIPIGPYWMNDYIMRKEL